MAEFPKHPFLLTVQETEGALGTNVDRGLTSEQVFSLQSRYPKNELDVGGTIPWYSILAKQVLNAMIIVRPSSILIPRTTY
jgi:magnesium-transporting ATPase (P-type)